MTFLDPPPTQRFRPLTQTAALTRLRRRLAIGARRSRGWLRITSRPRRPRSCASTPLDIAHMLRRNRRLRLIGCRSRSRRPRSRPRLRSAVIRLVAVRLDLRRIHRLGRRTHRPRNPRPRSRRPVILDIALRLDLQHVLGLRFSRRRLCQNRTATHRNNTNCTQRSQHRHTASTNPDHATLPTPTVVKWTPRGGGRLTDTPPPPHSYALFAAGWGRGSPPHHLHPQ
jgi:hypothetical protein